MKICKCGKQFYHLRNKCCSKECARTHSVETKDKISLRRKKYLEENPDKHVWKRHDKFKSEPCELIKQFLMEKDIKFVSEWQPLENKFYSVDIAFPDIKFGIEINGNQHYNRNGTLKEYYQNRHDEIVRYGWKLLELHYSIAWNLSKFESLLDIKDQPDYSEYFATKSKQDDIRKKNLPMRRGEKNKLSAKRKWDSHIELVKNCDIDFSKFGWGVQLSKILEISPQKSAQWMKRYFPEIFNNICFKVTRRSE
jgi:very-short-patch-repair endonuclease